LKDDNATDDLEMPEKLGQGGSNGIGDGDHHQEGRSVARTGTAEVPPISREHFQRTTQSVGRKARHERSSDNAHLKTCPVHSFLQKHRLPLTSH